MSPTLHLSSDADALADAAAAMFAGVLGEALDASGRASLALSGGSSPKPTYQRLAQAPLAWNGVGVSLVDERWVPSGAAGSNADFIRDCFAGTPAERAHFIPLYNGHDTAADGVEAAEQALALLKQPFDLCVLGMGSDGHTASWFPHSEGLDTALDPDNPATLCAIRAKPSEVTGPLTERITLTYAAVAQARHVVLMLPSGEKLAVFRDAMSKPMNEAPVAALGRLGDRLQVFGVE